MRHPRRSPPGIAATAGTGGWRAWWLLWLLFALIVFTITLLLLRACALGLPGVGLLGSGYCPRAGVQTIGELRSIVDDLERQVALQRLECESQQARPAPLQPPTANQAQAGPPAEDMQRRLDQHGAGRGPLQISLAWNDTSDLDLVVVCPQGVISFKAKTSCGGQLDIDQNSRGSATSRTPVENVVWSDAARLAPGEYKVQVMYCMSNSSTAAQVPFTVRVVNDGVESLTRGVANRPLFGSPLGFAPCVSSPVTVTTIQRQ